MKFISRVLLNIATLGPLGYGTMPGTMGTLATLPLVYLFHWMEMPVQQQVLIIGLVAVFSYLIILHVLPLFTSEDPPQIILDEVVGCLITFCAIPFSLHTLALGFMLFRFLDITKALGIKTCERLGGASGVLCDDVAAGLMSNIALRVAIFYVF